MVPVLKEPTVSSNNNVDKFNEHLLWTIQCNDIGMPYLSQPSQKALYEASTTMSPTLQSSLRLREVKQLNWLHTASNSLSWNSKAGSSAFSLHSGGHVCVHSLLVGPSSLWPYVLCPPGSSVQETGLKLVQRYLWGRSKGFNWGAQERLHKEGVKKNEQFQWIRRKREFQPRRLVWTKPWGSDDMKFLGTSVCNSALLGAKWDRWDWRGSRQFLILAETLNSILKVMRSIDGLLSGKSKIKVATGYSVEDRL